MAVENKHVVTFHRVTHIYSILNITILIGVEWLRGVVISAAIEPPVVESTSSSVSLVSKQDKDKVQSYRIRRGGISTATMISKTFHQHHYSTDISQVTTFT